MFKYFAAALLASTTFAVKLAEETEMYEWKPTEEEKNIMYAEFDKMLEEADTDNDGLFELDEYLVQIVDVYAEYAEMDDWEFTAEHEEELVAMITDEWAKLDEDEQAGMPIEDMKREMREDFGDEY